VTAAGPPGERAAAWLLRCYPRSWRDRYGAEFTALLCDEFAERRRPWRAVADVALSGLIARLGCAGLTGRALEPARQIRTSLATLGCAAAAFAAFGGALWAQLSTSAQWAAPGSAPARAGLAIMTAAVALSAAAGLAAAVPVAWCAVRQLATGRARELAGPAALAALGGAVLVIGAHHFQDSWPGTGGTAAAGLPVPGGVAAFCWAATMSVSSYWAHLRALGSFPAAQVGWMAVSPLAWLGLAAGSAAVLRRVRLPARLLPWLAGTAAAAAGLMALFAAGAACWVFGTGSAAAGLFHAGTVDVASLAVMTAAAAAAGRVAVTARRARLALAGRPAGG
jgi:hypothetical protein